MKPFYDRMTIVLKILFICLAGVLLFDYVLASGGYSTILVYSHPMLLVLPRIIIVVAFIWGGFNALVLAANHKWIKSGIFVLSIALVLIGAKLTIGVLAEKSARKAQLTVNSFFTGGNNTFAVKVNSEVERNYQAFASAFDPSAVSLLSSSPTYGRYNFLISPKAAEPFMVTLWVQDKGAKIWVTKRWDKRQLENK